MLDNYLTKPFVFHCVTDNPIKEYDLPIRHKNLKGMFIKMSLFEYTGKCLYLILMPGSMIISIS